MTLLSDKNNSRAKQLGDSLASMVVEELGGGLFLNNLLSKFVEFPVSFSASLKINVSRPRACITFSEITHWQSSKVGSP